MSAQQWIWTADGAALGVVLIAGIADWRRINRSSIDGWGWMPWRGVQMAAIFVAAVLTVVAVRN